MLYLITSAAEGLTKNNSPYVYGTLRKVGGEELPYKMWGMKLNDFVTVGTVVDIEGNLDSYNGTQSLIIHNISDYVDQDTKDFVTPNPNLDKYRSNFDKLLETNLTPEGYSLVRDILSHPDVGTFYEEFAASHHHDAVQGGLVSHSFKVTYYLVQMLKVQPALRENLNKDLLLIGSALHDLRKVWEYSAGVVNQEPMNIGHRVLLIEWLSSHWKDALINHLGRGGYFVCWQSSASIMRSLRSVLAPLRACWYI